MSQLENLRQKLHEVIESGDMDSIIRISQELDEIILRYMKTPAYNSRKTA